MGLINAFIDALDKKWGEQAMQRKIDQLDQTITEKERVIAEKRSDIEALRKKKAELLTIREIKAKADAAWARAFAERTGGTIPTNPSIGLAGLRPLRLNRRGDGGGGGRVIGCRQIPELGTPR